MGCSAAVQGQGEAPSEPLLGDAGCGAAPAPAGPREPPVAPKRDWGAEIERRLTLPPLLVGQSLVVVGELVSPRSMMLLPTWSRAAYKAVRGARPTLDPATGSITGRKVCITWAERQAEIEVLREKIDKLPSPGGLLPLEDFKALLERATALVRREPTVVPVKAPVTVVGSLMGHFEDLMTIFELAGKVPETRYVFLGNYATKGGREYALGRIHGSTGRDHNGVLEIFRTIQMLLLLKVSYPDRITLLRGAHEHMSIARVYGLYDSWKAHYKDIKAFKVVTAFFDVLPLVALIEDKIFCVHCGLSPEVRTMDDLYKFDRFTASSDQGPLYDLLWNDPWDGKEKGWQEYGRGELAFGEDVAQKFLESNGLTTLLRSGQVVEHGFEWTHPNVTITLYSAALYSDFDNEGAFIQYDADLTLTWRSFAGTKREPESKDKKGAVAKK